MQEKFHADSCSRCNSAFSSQLQFFGMLFSKRMKEALSPLSTRVAVINGVERRRRGNKTQRCQEQACGFSPLDVLPSWFARQDGVVVLCITSHCQCKCPWPGSKAQALKSALNSSVTATNSQMYQSNRCKCRQTDDALQRDRQEAQRQDSAVQRLCSLNVRRKTGIVRQMPRIVCMEQASQQNADSTMIRFVI
jgi:hypothetical protein